MLEEEEEEERRGAGGMPMVPITMLKYVASSVHTRVKGVDYFDCSLFLLCFPFLFPFLSHFPAFRVKILFSFEQVHYCRTCALSPFLSPSFSFCTLSLSSILNLLSFY